MGPGAQRLRVVRGRRLLRGDSLPRRASARKLRFISDSERDWLIHVPNPGRAAALRARPGSPGMVGTALPSCPACCCPPSPDIAECSPPVASSESPGGRAWIARPGCGCVEPAIPVPRRIAAPVRHDWHEAVEQGECGFVTRTSDHRVATTTIGATSWTMYESRLPVSATAPAR